MNKKNYYLYKLDENNLNLINSKVDSFEVDKISRINIIEKYIENLKDNIKLPTFNNKQNILSRLTININNAENISKQIRDKNIPSNTMYPVLVDRFKLFFNKNDYENSYKIKGKLLNLWTNDININNTETTLQIIKGNNE